MTRLLAKLFPRRALRTSIADLASKFWIGGDAARVERHFEELHRRSLLATPTEIRAAIKAAEEEEQVETTDQDEVTADEEAEAPYEVFEGVAHLWINGELFAQTPWLYVLFGIQVTTYDYVRASLRAAIDDPAVSAVLLIWNSPGGTIDGWKAAADDIRALRSVKPIHSHAAGMLASAAYGLAAQSTWISADEMSEVGSIGVLGLVVDSSKAAEEQGFKVHAIKSGEHKGVGAPGVPISDAQLAVLQENVDDVARVFEKTIADGRGIDAGKVKANATGRVWISTKAVELGLIDEVASLEAAHAKLVGGGSNEAREGGETEDAPGGAEGQEDALAKDGHSALAEQVKRLQATVDARASAVDNVVKGLKARAIATGTQQGRITAENIAMVQAFSDACGDDVVKLEAHIAGLPVQTTPQPAGTTPAQRIAAGPSSDSDRMIMRAFGLTEAEFAAADNVQSISLDGTARLNNGRRVALKDALNPNAHKTATE